MTKPLHHIHIRKRVHKKLQPYPHPDVKKRFLDILVAVFGMGSLFALIPQAVRIWSEKNADGVSEITWMYFFLYSILMLVYGLVHQEKPIIAIYGTTFGMYLLITVGAILY